MEQQPLRASGPARAPLRLLGVGASTIFTTSNIDPRNCRRNRPIAAHNGVGISRDTTAYAFPTRSTSLAYHSRLTDCHRGDPRGDARCEAPHSIPRQLRPPADPPQSVPVRDLLHAVEVRGTDHALARETPKRTRTPVAAGATRDTRSIDRTGLTDMACRRTRDTATKSASTSSSRSGSPR